MTELRVAGPADVDALVALVTSAYRGESSRGGWTTEADLLQGQRTDAAAVLATIEEARSELLVAESEHEIVACVNVADREDAGYLGMFAVSPTWQGGGLGKQVMVAAERYVQQVWGLTSMRMTVIEQRTELIAFYQRRGYRLTGRTEPFPYGEERFGVPQRDDLRFVVLEKQLAPPLTP